MRGFKAFNIFQPLFAFKKTEITRFLLKVPINLFVSRDIWDGKMAKNNLIGFLLSLDLVKSCWERNKSMTNIGVGCSLEEFKDKNIYKNFSLINIENPLYPGYLEKFNKEDIVLINKLTEYSYIVDGAYIDLNPGTSEPKIRKITKITKEKVIQSIDFAKRINAEEIIFLSTYIPFINVEFYEQGWLESSKIFWKEILKEESTIKISLCNTFEFNPDYLINIVENIDKDNFGLAFDIGHALLWGKISILSWYKRIEKYLNTIYLHSNDGKGDLHISFKKGLLKEKNNEFRKILELAQKRNINLILKYYDKSSVLKDKQILKKLLA